MTTADTDSDRVAVENAAGLPPREFAAWADVLGGHRSMRLALEWMHRRQPPLAPIGMVGQDEFSFDLIVTVPANASAGTDAPLWIVYSTS